MASTWHWDEQNDGSFPYTREQTETDGLFFRSPNQPTPSVNWQHSGNRARQNTIARRVRLASSAVVSPPPAPVSSGARALFDLPSCYFERAPPPPPSVRPGFFIALERGSVIKSLINYVSEMPRRTDPDSVANEMMMTMLKNRT